MKIKYLSIILFLFLPLMFVNPINSETFPIKLINTSFRVKKDGSKRTCYYKGSFDLLDGARLKNMSVHIQDRHGKKLRSSKAKINYKDAVADTLGGIIPEIIVPTHTKLIDIKPNKLEYIIKQF